MPDELSGPATVTRERARAMAAEIHDRIARKVGKGANFSATYAKEVAASAGAWRQSPDVDDETYRCALQYVCNIVALRATIERTQRKSRWALWR